MKLLFDENLALPSLLASHFSGSTHLTHCGLRGADDADVWNYARSAGFVIVTKDDDFRELALLRGSPPKLVMIVAGNCTTKRVAELLTTHEVALRRFIEDDVAAVVELPLPG